MHGTQPFQFELDAFVVIVVDVVIERVAQMLHASEAMSLVALGLERAEEAFHRSIVEAVPLAGLALSELASPQLPAKRRHSIFASLGPNAIAVCPYV